MVCKVLTSMEPEEGVVPVPHSRESERQRFLPICPYIYIKYTGVVGLD